MDESEEDTEEMSNLPTAVDEGITFGEDEEVASCLANMAEDFH